MTAAATPTAKTYENSVAVVAHNLRRAAEIGAEGVVVHTGSYVDTQADPEGAAQRHAAALAQVREGLLPILETLGDDGPWLLLEPTAGQGRSLCAGVEDLGDVGVLDDAGNLRITDRLKDMYISGGFNVYPAEVEQSLMRLEGLSDVAVVGVPDERMGEVGKAFVVRAATSAGEDLTDEVVVSFAREHLANFKVPRQVEFTGALPRNLSGKVLKKDLRGG